MSTITQETWRRLRSYATRYVGSDPAQDVVQRVLLRLGACADTALYFTAVRNEAISMLRENAARARAEEAGGRYCLGEAQTSQGYDGINAEISAEFLQTFTLVCRDGMTCKEAGKAMGVLEATVKTRMKRLRALVSENTA